MTMTQRLLFVALIFWVGSGMAGGWAALAEDAGPPASLRKVGVVNLNRVFKEYGGTKSTEARLEQLGREKQAEREKIVNEIRTMREELALLNEENRNKQREAMDGKMRALAQFDQQARDQMQGERQQAIDNLLKEIERIVTVYAKQNGYDLILTDRAVLFFAEGIDVTDEILQILNQQGKKG